MSLPAEKEKECKLVFDLFDSDKDGCIAKNQIEKVARGLGAYVPGDDLNDFLSEFSEDKINYDHFIKFFTTYYTKKVDKNELIQAFEFLDKGKSGNYDAKELKHSLMVFGDKLTEEEVDALLGPYIKNGVIDYKKFSDEMAK